MIICIPVLNRYDLLTKFLITVDPKPSLVYIINNGLNDILGYTIPKVSYDIHIYTPVQNLGVTASWNHFLHKFEDCIIMNDDVVLPKNWPDLYDESLFSCAQNHEWFYWSCFRQQKQLCEKIGFYDENMRVYYSDLDYKIRMQRVGLDLNIKDVKIKHAIGGSIAKMTPEQKLWREEIYKTDGEYFKLKWGGERDAVYKNPFNIGVE